MDNTFGERIRDLREDADLNQTELGKCLGMTQRKVSYLECGKYEPSIDDIVALCRFFKVSSDYLLGLSEKARPQSPPQGPRVGENGKKEP